MKTSIISFILLLFLSFNTFSQQKKSIKKTYTVVKTKNQWRAKLTQSQFYVLRESGTERAFSSELNNNKLPGIYACAACKTPLYESKYKYDSYSGWPSFDRAIKENVELDIDYKIGYARTELKCNTCGGHLGHSFNDGPRETTGERHCVNGAALLFIPKKKE